MTSPAILSAIYQRLAVDPGLLAMLDSALGAGGGDGGLFEGEPKVFTESPVPDGVPQPLVVIGGPLSGPSESVSLTDSRQLRREARRIALYWPRTGDTTAVDVAAEHVKRLLHRAPLDVSPSKLRRVTATGPTELPTEVTGVSVGRGIEAVIVFIDAAA